jgi:hypothetical protein
MDDTCLPEKQRFIGVDVTGKTTGLWQSLRPKLIQAMTDFLDTVVDDAQGTTVRDEMKQLTTALLDYAKANLARPGLENEQLEAQIRRLYVQMEIDRAEARKKHAEADTLELNNKVKRLRLVLGMAQAFLVGDASEEAVIFTAQIEAFRTTLNELTSS